MALTPLGTAGVAVRPDLQPPFPTLEAVSPPNGQEVIRLGLKHRQGTGAAGGGTHVRQAGEVLAEHLPVEVQEVLVVVQKQNLRLR